MIDVEKPVKFRAIKTDILRGVKCWWSSISESIRSSMYKPGGLWEPNSVYKPGSVYKPKSVYEPRSAYEPSGVYKPSGV